MSKPPHESVPRRPLYRHCSWSPESVREAAWERRKTDHIPARHSGSRLNRSLSVKDLEELRACFELGFGFDLPNVKPRLCDTIPALEFYKAALQQYKCESSRSSWSSLSTASDCDSDNAPSVTLFDSADDVDVKKTKLRHWAHAVACLARPQSSTCTPTADTTHYKTDDESVSAILLE